MRTGSDYFGPKVGAGCGKDETILTSLGQTFQRKAYLLSCLSHCIEGLFVTASYTFPN